MSIIRTFICDACGMRQAEEQEGFGVPGWSQLKGMHVKHDATGHEIHEPLFCISCSKQIFGYVIKNMIGDPNGLD